MIRLKLRAPWAAAYFRGSELRSALGWLLASWWRPAGAEARWEQSAGRR
jgi:hypothetical protein